MKKMIITTAVALMLQFQTHCQLKNYNHEGSHNILAEKVELSVTGVQAKLKKTQHAAGLVTAAGTILPPVVDLVVNSIKEKAKKNALAYKGEYKAFASGEKFYINNKDAYLPQLTLKRVIKLKKDETEPEAVKMKFIPELSDDKTAFRYYIKDNCKYMYSIAKTKGKYDYIDLNIEIKFKSISIDKDQYKINDLRTTNILIPMIKVGHTNQLLKKVFSGWIPLPPRSTARNSNPLPIEEKKTITKTDKNGKKQTTKEKTVIEKSDAEKYEKLPDNTGLYEIEITVTETNPYKIKAENKQEVIESSSESGTSIIKTLIEVLTKEKESE